MVEGGSVDRQSFGYITQCEMRPCTTQRKTLIVIRLVGYRSLLSAPQYLHQNESISHFPYPSCDFQDPYAADLSPHPIANVNNHKRKCCCRISFVLITFAANTFSGLHARYYRLTVG